MNKKYAAGGIIVRKKDEIWLYLLLLQEMIDGTLEWNCPKGHIEEGESAEEGARREIFEETGLQQIEKIDYLGAYTYPVVYDSIPYEKEVKWYLFCTGQEKTALCKEEGYIESHWLTYEEIIAKATHPTFIPFIQKADELLTKKSVAK